MFDDMEGVRVLHPDTLQTGVIEYLGDPTLNLAWVLWEGEEESVPCYLPKLLLDLID